MEQLRQSSEWYGITARRKVRSVAGEAWSRQASLDEAAQRQPQTDQASLAVVGMPRQRGRMFGG